MPVVHLGSTYVGQSNSTAHQIWCNGKGCRFGFEYDSTYKPLWTWSGFELDSAPNSVKFTPDPANGGLQGDLSIGIGSINSAYPNPVSAFNKTNTPLEIDPAGGTLEFSMIARELSYWHKIGPVLRISNTSQIGNTMDISECRAYFLENKSQYDIKKVPYDTKVNSLYYTKFTNTYSYEYVFDVWKSDISTTYQPSKNNYNDLTFTCRIGPNNTPYPTYVYIGLLGFANEANNIEYNNTSAVHPYALGEVSGVLMSITNPPIGRPVPNIKNSSNTYFDWRIGGTTLVTTGIPNQRLICLWQKPNVLYYVHMVWINPQYTDYDTAPTASEAISSQVTNWDVTDFDLLLYIEFGISPNGGYDIYWNNNESTDVIKKVYERGISATVPQDIHKHIKVKVESTSINRQNTSPYTVTVSKTETNSKPFKFVRVNVHLSSKNDEHNNLSENRYQKYAILNYKQLDGNIQTTNRFDPNNYGIHYARFDYNPCATTYFQYQIGRKYKTNKWNLQTSATLYYENGSMRYEGETTIH